MNSVVLPNQIRSIDRQRLIRRLGRVGQDTMAEVDRALILSLGLTELYAGDATGYGRVSGRDARLSLLEARRGEGLERLSPDRPARIPHAAAPASSRLPS